MSDSIEPLVDVADFMPLDRLASLKAGPNYRISETGLWELCGVIFGDRPVAVLEYAFFDSNCHVFEDLPPSSHLRALDLSHQPTAHLVPGEPHVSIHHEVALSLDTLSFGDWHDETLPKARILGRKYGYPEEAIDAYLDFQLDGNRGFGGDSHEYMRSLVDDGVIEQDEFTYARLVNWVPPMTEDGVRQASEAGRRRYERNVAFAEEHDLDTLAQRIRDYCETHR